MSNLMPQLSVVIVMVGDTVTRHCDTTNLVGTLDALMQQADAPSMEIIVPYHSRVSGVDELRQRFPHVDFLPVEKLQTLTDRIGSREHHDELRARGMMMTHAEIIAFLEDHVRPDALWAARIMQAHRQWSFAGIGGAIENGIDRPLNWAVYYCDLGKYQNPIPAGESLNASLVNMSYKRAALEAIKPTWQDAFNETVVHAALITQGRKLALSPDITVYQHREDLQLEKAVREFFIWGKSYAAIRSHLIINRQRVVFTLLAPLLPAILLLRMALRVVKKKRTVGAFIRALPLTILITTSWSWGELIGYVMSLANKLVSQVATRRALIAVEHRSTSE